MNKTMKHIASFVVLTTILTVPAIALGQWQSGINNAQSSGVPEGRVIDIIKNIMNWLLGILGFLGIIGFVISGILYLVSAGDDDGIKRAKSAMVYSIIGVVVALVGFVIIQAVDSLLRASGTSF